MSILIVVSDYYEDVSNNLIIGAKNYLINECNQDSTSIEVKKVSGCFEIPYCINLYDSFDAYIALGCIIRGETYHFELIANEVTRKIMDLSVDKKKPVGFGILTCENHEQALKRSDPKKGNKGKEAAYACFSLLKDTINAKL